MEMVNQYIRTIKKICRFIGGNLNMWVHINSAMEKMERIMLTRPKAPTPEKDSHIDLVDKTIF